MKRGRGDQLTGGSGDVNPQTFVIHGLQTAADTTTIIQQPLPIPRLPTRPGKNLVIELLALDYYHVNPTIVGTTTTLYLFDVTTQPNAFASIALATQDARSLDMWYKGELTAVAVANIVAVYQPVLDYHSDLTDEAGHGLLVATDNLYLHVMSQNTQAATEVAVHVTYRWKEVSLTEYIGIVQSQQ